MKSLEFNEQSEIAHSKLIQAGLREIDLRDWLTRHPLPNESWVIVNSIYGSKHSRLILRITFSSYREANNWAHQHTQFLEKNSGYDKKTLYEMFLDIPMVDFDLHLAFPEETHPKFFPALNIERSSTLTV